MTIQLLIRKYTIKKLYIKQQIKTNNDLVKALMLQQQLFDIEVIIIDLEQLLLNK